ncbi:unnamed protein product [Dracunculus medinensis]|uniref:Caprin-1_dimer domain-containing protein n=1 Tax=Dracunculus medinensis TaxID=318479 RepID=A0A0N4UJ64_DRAME|nr:unnamed protein product [Dracunculus medinensis]
MFVKKLFANVAGHNWRKLSANLKKSTCNDYEVICKESDKVTNEATYCTANITSLLSSLEQQYVEHKEKFEKWRLDNIKQCGTDTYNQYVAQFQRWEAGVKEQQRKLMDELNNLMYSGDSNRILGKAADSEKYLEVLYLLEMLANQDCVFSDGLLSRLSFDDFLLVVVMMTKEDPSFFPSLLSAFKNSKKNGDSVNTAFYQQYAAPAGIGNPTVSSYVPQQTFAPAAPQMHSVLAYHYLPVHPTERSEQTTSNTVVKRSYDQIVTTPVGARESWQIEEPLRKSYKPPSPIRGYRNPSTLPYRDFSQT